MDRTKQGRTAKHNGKQFEKLLDGYFAYWKAAGLFSIEKTPEPYRYIKPCGGAGGMFIATFAKSAQPDYKGTLNGGRAIVLEAKSISKDRINLSQLTETEAAELHLHYRLGAISGVIVYEQETNLIYFFPAKLFCKIDELTGFKHIKFKDAGAFIIDGIQTNALGAMTRIQYLYTLGAEKLAELLQNGGK